MNLEISREYKRNLPFENHDLTNDILLNKEQGHPCLARIYVVGV